jgi:septal ring factor EnvC (AmiA/AmiB activator)
MMTEIAMLAAGLVVGAVAVWFTLKAKIRAAAEKATAQSEADRAGLTATLQARDSQIQALSTSLEKSNGENSRLQGELTSRSAQLATAEEKNTRIPTLETELNENALKIAELLAEATILKEAQAGLTTTIAEERKAAEEKLALLNDVQHKPSRTSSVTIPARFPSSTKRWSVAWKTSSRAGSKPAASGEVVGNCACNDTAASNTQPRRSFVILARIPIGPPGVVSEKRTGIGSIQPGRGR